MSFLSYLTFAQMCILIESVSQLSNAAHGPLVLFLIQST